MHKLLIEFVQWINAYVLLLIIGESFLFPGLRSITKWDTFTSCAAKKLLTNEHFFRKSFSTMNAECWMHKNLYLRYVWIMDHGAHFWHWLLLYLCMENCLRKNRFQHLIICTLYTYILRIRSNTILIKELLQTLRYIYKRYRCTVYSVYCTLMAFRLLMCFLLFQLKLRSFTIFLPFAFYPIFCVLHFRFDGNAKQSQKFCNALDLFFVNILQLKVIIFQLT